MGDSIIDASSTPSEVGSEVMVVVIILLSMVIIFVLFLHLFAHWSRNQGADIEAHPIFHHRPRRRRAAFNFAPTQDPPVVVHKGLEPSLLRDLPVLIFHHDNFNEGIECAVCLCELEDGEKARLLPECNHGFHVDCIDMWFQSHSTCPLCRNTVGDSTPEFHSLQHLLGSEYSIESPDFATNISSEISTEGYSVDSPMETSSSSTSSLVIEIPVTNRRLADGMPPSRLFEEEMKSPVMIRLGSLRRLLSRDKRIPPCSLGSVDVEQGGGGGQSSITSSEAST